MQPTAYMGIDVNPSIELGVNRFDVVVCAEGLNDDGEAVLAGHRCCSSRLVRRLML
ncbi:anti-sigma-I factor RsgI family protein [Slackia isoflavoniconvertens]|uniref:anti-sigma-I factor RsgI family protein n=1 Tax=Slackia isoflavoniconvertens TaxID=572010 RepID=UPI0015F0C2A1|nr:hypothetical protein [Slackia isoflavoniconvertens]